VADPAAPGGAPAAAPAKKSAQREKLIVGGTIVLVLLTYLILRRASASANNPATSATAVPAGIDPNTGLPYATEYAGSPAMGYGSPATGNYLNPQDPTLLALEGQLSAIQSSVATVPATSISTGSGGSPASTGATGSPTPTTGPITSTLNEAGLPYNVAGGVPNPLLGSASGVSYAAPAYAGAPRAGTGPLQNAPGYNRQGRPLYVGSQQIGWQF
jgi:hypothetical protein